MIRYIRIGFLYWAWVCGILVACYIPAWGIVKLFFGGESPVSVHTEQKLVTFEVPIGKDLIYTVNVDRRRPCRGNVVDMFESLHSGIQVIRERPIISNTVEKNRFLRTSAPLPPSIPIGPAHFKSSLISNCPEGIVTDVIFEGYFEVVAR